MDILWEDETAMVVGKPSGLLTTAPANVPSLEAELHAWLCQQAGSQSSPYFRLPHRLDRPVSGALLIARTPRAASMLAAQFQSGKVEKRYLAMVEGCVATETGQWLDTMRKIPNHAQAELVDAKHPHAKHAVLNFSVTQRFADRTLLDIQLETGRMHQIRLQASSRGHAILGDTLYGSDLAFGNPVTDLRQAAIALHAYRIGFRHPRTALPITVDAPLPDYWPQDVQART